MLRGYALGGIISQANFLLSQQEKSRLSLVNELLKIEQDKVNEINSEEYKNSGTEEQQKRLNFYAKKILHIKSEIEKVNNEIDKLIDKANPYNIEESLPLDKMNVKTLIENRRLDHLQFTSKESNVYAKIQSFVSQLLLQDASFTIFPPGSLEMIAKKVENMLVEANREVTFIGSFITLERVKTIDLLLIQPNTKISDTLIQNADKYYILSEAVLGGVFLGLSKSSSITKNENQKEENKSSLFVSFTSQGAIPKLNHNLREIDLWKVYNDWKETLIDDPDGGYPIGFKVRRLTDVFYENGIKVPNTESLSVP